MNKPQCLKIENEYVYLADDLRKYDKTFFTGCMKTSRLIVEKKKISEDAYLFITKRNDIWKISVEKYKKAYLAIKYWWVDENMESMKKTYISEPVEIKFDDSLFDGITVRGSNDVTKCYFKVVDINKKIDIVKIDNLNNTVDYVYFGGTKNKIMYLTYNGLIKFIFTSRNKKAESFQEWASRILFTHQVGTQEQKQKLIKSLVGVDVNNAIELLTTSVSDIACVYLLVIDTVKNLRSKMKISDDFEDTSYICKYGETDDLRRRISEHKKTFAEYNDNIKLKYYSIIDASNVTRAETSMRNKFEHMDVTCDLIGQKELIILDKQQLKDVSNIYEETGIVYGASLKDYKTQTDKKIIELEHQYDIDTIKLKSEIELLKKDVQIITKEKEIMQMEMDKLKKKLKKYTKKK